MSDCRLSHEGVVEDEVEVRAEEYTLSGGQESYLRPISITLGHDGEIDKAHGVAIVASHRVSRLLGWCG